MPIAPKFNLKNTLDLKSGISIKLSNLSGFEVRSKASITIFLKDGSWIVPHFDSDEELKQTTEEIKKHLDKILPLG